MRHFSHKVAANQGNSSGGYLMYIKKAKVLNRLGIHGRVASEFAQTATTFESQVFIERADDPMRKANAKSVVFLIALCLAPGDEVIISAEGEDEEKAVTALIDLLAKFAEDDK